MVFGMQENDTEQVRVAASVLLLWFLPEETGT